MKYKHVIFDVDGTLLDSEFAVLSAWRDTLEELQNKVYSEDELLFTLGIPGEVTLARLGVADVDAGYKLWWRYFAKYTASMRLFESVVPMLEELRSKGYKLGIVTSKPRSEFDTDKELLRITKLLGTIICVEDSERPKPYADPILKYMELEGITAKDAIYIGDSVYDYQCARCAGVDFGLAAWGKSFAQDIDANFTLKHPKEVLEVVVSATC